MKQEGGKQKMDGILFIDKEKGWTSRDVVNFISHQFQTKKVGHVGTLDPFATGLLIVLVGKATKIAPYLEAQEKEYEATLLLGADTDTLDLEGEVVLEKEGPDLSLEAIEETLHTFKGTIEQVVPKYSAVKYKGKALYRYAFANEKTPEISRKITIHDIHFMSYVDHQLSFSVHCSKGTYIRQLGQDIAHDLSTCGHLTSLRRTKIGEVSIFDAKKVKEIEASDFISIKEALSFLPTEVVDEATKKDIINGKTIRLLRKEDILLTLDENGEVLSILEKVEKHTYKVKRGLF